MFPWWGIRVGTRETLAFLLKFFSRSLLASFSDQAAGDWHSGCMSLGSGDAIFAVVKAKVKVPCAPLAPRLCPNGWKEGPGCALSQLGLDLVCSSGGGAQTQRASAVFIWSVGESERFEKSLVQAATRGSNGFTSHLPVVK